MLISWFYVPLTVVVFFAYISVLIGIKLKSVCHLRFGEIILGINAIVNVLLEVAAVVIEIFVPNDEIIDSVKNRNNHWIEQR
uniref:Uncharacterized protein n=1 Tax=Panagrolaimus davidi TaxID=227884 RepID=A0A914Q6J5_9BILA